jgi:hypothetical protein
MGSYASHVFFSTEYGEPLFSVNYQVLNYDNNHIADEDQDAIFLT